MRKKYQISINEVLKLVDSHSHVNNSVVTSHYEQNEKDVKKHLTNIFSTYAKDNILDGAAISRLFFPSDIAERFKVFISHSGSDAQSVKALAKVLEMHGLNCFVDWMVWGDLKELQSLVDDNLCHPITKPNGGKTYSYELRNYTTAHTHAMLSMALLDMIDQCDICVFITSNNSTIQSANFTKIQTLSPWIYEEVSYMNHIERKEVRMFSEGASIVRISHPLDLSGFEILTAQTIIPMLKALYD